MKNFLLPGLGLAFLLYAIVSAVLNFKTESSSPATKTAEYSGWVAWWKEDQSLNSLTAAKDKLNEILPVWYVIDENGKLAPTNHKRKAEIQQLASESNISISATIGNDFDGERIHKLLTDPTLREELLSTLISVAKTDKYQGWDVDWEQVKKEDKNDFTQFMDDLSAKLHQQGLKLSVTVHARTGLNDWEGTLGMDYKALGELADSVRIMAYDYHHKSSTAGPITPINWYDEVIKYAKSEIPIEKIVIALPTYGYDWVGTSGSAIEYIQIQQDSDLFAQIKRDQESKALTGTYEKGGLSHELWLEDAESIVEKINLAKNAGIYRFCFWKVGGEDPEIWGLLPS